MYGAVSVVVATQYDHHGGRPVDDLGGVNERVFKNASRSSSSRHPGDASSNLIDDEQQSIGWGMVVHHASGDVGQECRSAAQAAGEHGSRVAVAIRHEARRQLGEWHGVRVNVMIGHDALLIAPDCKSAISPALTSDDLPLPELPVTARNRVILRLATSSALGRSRPQNQRPSSAS